MLNDILVLLLNHKKKDQKTNMENTLITDDILEQLGFERTIVTYENRDELLSEFQKYPLINEKPVWNSIAFHENATWFKLGYNRFLEKLDHGYLLLVFDVFREIYTPDENYPVITKEKIFSIGPFWVTSVFTCDELYSLLTVLHIDFQKINL